MNAAGALVLTAGLGTRLRPLTCLRAKAAVPVNGEPLVRRIVRRLVAQQYRDVVLNLHHKPDTIAALIGDGSDLGAHVRYSWEQPVLGSAGGPRHALPLLAETFLIVNGDTVTDVDVAALAAAHDGAGAAVTMALIRNPQPDKYGGVRVSDDGWVTGFTRRGTPGESFHFIGAQMARREVFAPLEDGVPAESVGSLYPRLIERNPRSVKAFVTEASFEDIGTVDDYLRTSLALAGREGDRLARGARVRVDDSVRLERTAVWDDVVIGANASLTECVVADGVRIPANARFTRCAIVPAGACEPAANARVEGDLLIAPF
jgi:NDP-sugar pyrophosphorylase family protein